MPGVQALAARDDLLSAFRLTLVMSHLACADNYDHPKTAEQTERFDAMRALLPPAPASLAASGGIQLGPRYHYDLTRPGVALYGGKALEGAPPMAPVVTLLARIATLREAEAGETVGYGAGTRSPGARGSRWSRPAMPMAFSGFMAEAMNARRMWTYRRAPRAGAWARVDGPDRV